MKELVAQLCGVAFLSLLAESLLPEGSFQKYARMVSGLLIMLVLLNSLSHKHDFLNFSWETVPESFSVEAAEKEQVAQIMVEYRRRLEEEIGEKSEMGAHVELKEDMSIRSITLEGTPSQELREQLASEYGVEIEHVRGVTP